MKLKMWGFLGQWLGMLAILGGIYVEWRLGAHIGWATISLGSLIYAVSTKLVHRRK